MLKFKIKTIARNTFFAAFAACLAGGAVHARDPEKSAYSSGYSMEKRVERLCAPQPDQMSDRARADRMSEKMASRLALNDTQKGLFKNLQDAREKGRNDLKTATCADKPDVTTFLGKLKYQEKMAEGRVAMLKATRPSIEAFYNSLDETQKDKFTSLHQFGGRKKHKNEDRSRN